MTGFTLSFKSLLNRKVTSILTALTISFSVILLLGIERIQVATKQGFESTVSGVDLIVGAKGGPLNLLLYSVFHIGNATNNVSYKSFQKYTEHKEVEWTVPISLGDSHRGHRVVGTNQAFLKHYKYGKKQHIKVSKGKYFQKENEVVIGHQVAKKLKYKVGDKITLTHGMQKISAFQEHKDHPFTIIGILSPTSTPIDHSLFVSLEAITAIHIDWVNGAPPKEKEKNKSNVTHFDLTPHTITAFFMGLKSRRSVFYVQREVNEDTIEPLMGILPGIVLRDLWNTIRFIETTLFSISMLVFIVSLISLTVTLYSTLSHKRREIAIFRSLGASKLFIFKSFFVEALLLTTFGIAGGLLLLFTVILFITPILEQSSGIKLDLITMTQRDFLFIGAIYAGALLASLLPASMAYKNSLSDGLMVRN